MRLSFLAPAIAAAILIPACESLGKTPTYPSPSTAGVSASATDPIASATTIALNDAPTVTQAPRQIAITQPSQAPGTPTSVVTAVPLTPTASITITPTPFPRVGAGLPDFTLPVATGGTITLSEYIGKKNVVLVFYRAWWCLYCRDQLIELRNHHREIMAQDAVVLAVSTDNLEGAKYAVDTFAAPFAILYDVTTQVPRQYNVFNLHGDGLASASIFIIDKTGQLRFKEVGEVYTHQVSSAKIVSEIKRFQQ